MRIGHGYDVHRFKDSGRLVLGGVEIDYPRGLEAHSDGDVVIHALCDALLGAAALGDIGQYFPDTHSKFKNIDSRILLRHVRDLIEKENYLLENVDLTIVAQEPKLSPYILQMRTCLADDLQVGISQLNIKATTTEKLGFTGRKEGIAVYAVVLIRAAA